MHIFESVNTNMCNKLKQKQNDPRKVVHVVYLLHIVFSHTQKTFKCFQRYIHCGTECFSTALILLREEVKCVSPWGM